MKKVGILWVSWSIGSQTIDILKNYRQDFQLISVSAGKNITYLREVLNEFPEVQIVSVSDEKEAIELQKSYPKKHIFYWENGLNEVATADIDILITAVVGSIWLIPTYKAIEKGITIWLANKETLVTAGKIIMEKAKEKGVSILPVDSEHCALFQCLKAGEIQEVKRLIITASGWALRDTDISKFPSLKKSDVLKHPNWSMGQKITVDSATMMNKALEVIEAHHLFQIPYENIEAVIHKESIIHSLVEFIDGSMMAQMGTPDMRLPIQYALTYPERKKVIWHQYLDFTKVTSLHFENHISKEKYPCFYLAKECGIKGGIYPTIMNAANEVAVEAFLQEKIHFTKIIEIIEQTLTLFQQKENLSLQEILDFDRESRIKAQEIIKKISL